MSRCVLNFLVFLSSARAETFHVSPLGSDVADGLSAATAWRTLPRASLQPLGPGDSLLLSRDATWLDETLQVTAAEGSVVGAYGDETLPLPLLQMGRSVSQVTTCAHVTAGPGVTVRDLHLSGCAQALVIESAEVNTSGVVVQGCFFRDIKTPFLVYNPPNPAWASAISTVGKPMHNLTVRNNIADRIDIFFASHVLVDGMHIGANTVQQCAGNCYSLGVGTNILMENNVMLRDMSDRLFMYGTTDVIVGGLRGNNEVSNNDFNARGEYQGGPDGCAFDFETSATGFLIKGNTFHRSWGAGIMIFGHDTTSHDIQIVENVFSYNGCVQNRDDKGGIAVMCPNGQKPSGQIAHNAFLTCPGSPGIYVNPHVDGCADDLTMLNNSFDEELVVEMPQVSFNPPPSDCTDTSGTYPVIGVTRTENATIRYTLDGSRPTEESPNVPVHGIPLPWPSPAVAVNMRAFKAGMRPSVTNGAILELNYGLGRLAPRAKVGAVDGVLDHIVLTEAPHVQGWVVDTALADGGVAPVVVTVRVDFEPVSACLANDARPDLVTAGVAPNPEHGFTCTLPSTIAKGKHFIDVVAVGSPSSQQPHQLRGAPKCVCDGAECACDTALMLASTRSRMV